MRRLIILGILLGAFSSAHRKPPAELLSQEQMISILVDLEVAKAMVAHYTTDQGITRQLLTKNTLVIFQVYDVDLDTFQKSYRYYLTHLEIMQEIYGMVIKRLEELET